MSEVKKKSAFKVWTEKNAGLWQVIKFTLVSMIAGGSEMVLYNVFLWILKGPLQNIDAIWFIFNYPHGAEGVMNDAGVIGRGTKVESRSTGQLLSALGTSGVKLDRQGNHNVKVGFAEPRRDGDSNAKIANILEYGRHGQPAKPFLKPAKSASKSAAIEAMKRKLEEEVQNK